jgi:hypothetical protein
MVPVVPERTCPELTSTGPLGSGRAGSDAWAWLVTGRNPVNEAATVSVVEAVKRLKDWCFFTFWCEKKSSN